MSTPIDQQLFWVKYRPKTLKSMILLPRVRELVSDGIQMNLILHGTTGTGKSTLAKILCEGTHCLSLNTSSETSVDLLKTANGRRGKILEHISSMPPFNMMTEDGQLPQKVVYLDEFDRASATYQDAFKGFVEMYSDTRFILTTNHFDAIIPEIRGGRFTKICFDPLNKEEEDYLKDRYVKYLNAVKKHAGLELDDDTIPKIVESFFPDLRESVQKLQELKVTGKRSLTSGVASYMKGLFDYLMDGENDPVSNFNFVMENYLSTFNDAFKYMGRPFFSYLMAEHREVARSKGGRLIKLAKVYNERLGDTIDPIVHLVSYINEVKEVLR